ncbi:MAG: DEAD/DEAH box helicase family protein, partial [Thermoplasmata archaeon]
MFKITRDIEVRKYQKDALQKAIESKRCIICLPTGTGKTLVGLMYACYLLNEKEVRKILILEPTRFLVTQVTDYYIENSNIETKMLYGTTPRDERITQWRKGKVVVTTPQTAFNDIDHLNFDAIIVDECHHTTGEHAYAKLM